jgi:hypothetical protein
MTNPMRTWRPGTSTALPWLRVVDGIALLSVCAAVAIWLWPVRVSTVTPDRATTLSTSGTLASSVSPIGSADSLIADAVNGNVFSASRRAPTTRFVVPGSADVMAAPAAMAMAADSTVVGDDAESWPKLSGIVSVSGERQALLQLAAADGHASLYRAGDVHAGYRIVRIEANLVVLAHRAGTRTLRLSDRRLQDSLEVSRE